MTLSHDKTLIASCSPDDIIKVMDISYLKDRPKDGSFNLEAYEATLDHKPNHLKPEVEIKEVFRDNASSVFYRLIHSRVQGVEGRWHASWLS